MHKKEVYKMQADFCKSMANPKRIEIISLLGQNEKRVEEIAAIMGINLANVSQHLAIMRGKGIVEARREGKMIYYRIADPDITLACIKMKDLMIQQLERKIESIVSKKNRKIKIA